MTANKHMHKRMMGVSKSRNKEEMSVQIILIESHHHFHK